MFGYRKRNMGGLNHKRYQRRIENKREAFAREAAAALEELVTHEGARRVILAGDAVAIPLLHQALSPLLEPLIHEEILRLDIRTPRHEALSEIAPILTQVEEEESHARADRLVEAVREQGLGVIGLQETRDALEHGEGEVLVLAEEAPLDEQERSEDVKERFTPYQRLHQEVLQAERMTMIQMRTQGTINDEVLHRLEREFDLEEEQLK